LLGVAAMGAHFVWQIAKLNPQDEDLVLRLFRSNREAGLLLFAGLFGEALRGLF